MLESEDTVAWLTPHAAIVRVDGRAGDYVLMLGGSACQFAFTVDSKAIVVVASSLEALSEICDVVIRLLAVSVVHSVILNNWSSSALSTLPLWCV
jgi:hypothetical protein